MTALNLTLRNLVFTIVVPNLYVLRPDGRRG